MWDLNSRPGRALASCLGGARQRLMQPGRCLLTAIVVAFGTERVSANFSESEGQKIFPETANGVQSLLVSTADLVLKSQAFLITTNLLLTGLFSLTVLRLFRDQFERLSQAVAFSAFVVAHSVFLETTAEWLYVTIRYLNAGPSTGLPTNVSVVVTVVYVVIATVSTLEEGLRAPIAVIRGGRLAGEGRFIRGDDVHTLVKEAVIHDQPLLASLLVEFAGRSHGHRHVVLGKHLEESARNFSYPCLSCEGRRNSYGCYRYWVPGND